MDKKEFTCSLDGLSKGITAFTLLGLPALLIVLMVTGDRTPAMGLWMVLGISLVLPVVMFTRSPFAVGADKAGIWIRRRVGLKKILHHDIMDVRLPEENEMRGAIRTFGNGGLFGYTGYYRNSKVGSMLWFCTRRSNYVLIVRASGPVVVITPDDPEGFLEHYRTVSAP